jgi:hypothetical protein
MVDTFLFAIGKCHGRHFFLSRGIAIEKWGKKEKGKKVLRECGTHVTFSVMNRILRHSPNSVPTTTRTGVHIQH